MSLLTTVTRRMEFDAAHRVLRHESKCAHLHGHRYAVEMTVQAPRLDSVGRVVDFGVVKSAVGAWIDDNLDHGTLVNTEDLDLREWLLMQKQKHFEFPGNPTAEVIAAALLAVGGELLPSPLRVVRVRVYETPNCYAEVSNGVTHVEDTER